MAKWVGIDIVFLPSLQFIVVLTIEIVIDTLRACPVIAPIRSTMHPGTIDSDRARLGFSFGQLLKQKYDVTWIPGVYRQQTLKEITVSHTSIKYTLYIVKRIKLWLSCSCSYILTSNKIWMILTSLSLKKLKKIAVI